jgi:hypothetical protein
VKNSAGEYTVRAGDPPTVPAYESLISNTFSLTRILNNAGALASQGLVTEDGVNLSVYGLDRPRAELHIQPNKGNGVVLSIGNEAPDGSSVYVCKEGDPAVYQAGKWETESFLQGILDLVDKEVSPQLEDDGYGAFKFEQITLGGTVRLDGPVQIVHENQDNVLAGRVRNNYRIIRPIDTSLDMDKGLNALKALVGISADRAIARIAGPGDLAAYGLDRPYSTAIVSGTLGQGLGGFALRATKPDADGNIYIHRDGAELVYQVAAERIPWLEMSWWDLMTRLIILPYIEDIAQVEVRGPARSVIFALSGTGDDLVVEAQGLTLDTSFFRGYYQTLIGAMYQEYTEEKISAGALPFLETVYRYRDGRPPDRVSFYAAASRRVLVSLNGRRPFYAFSAYTDKVLSDLDRILEGKRVLPYL